MIYLCIYIAFGLGLAIAALIQERIKVQLVDSVYAITWPLLLVQMLRYPFPLQHWIVVNMEQ